MKYEQGTSITESYPWGIYVKARVLCPDGRVRTTKRIAATADTFFSIPASVTVQGKTVSGYVTFDDDTVKFVPYKYGKNGGIFNAKP